MVLSSLRKCLATLLLGAALLTPAAAQDQVSALQASSADLRPALALPAGAALRLERLTLAGQVFSADLRRINTDDSGTLLVVHSDSDISTTRPAPSAHFTGQLVGVSASKVFVSIDEQGAMRGIVHRGEEVFVIDKIAPEGAAPTGAADPSTWALRSRKVDLAADAPSQPFDCEVDQAFTDKHFLAPTATFLEKLRENQQLSGTMGAAAGGVQALGAQRRADLIIETDYELYQRLGSNSSAVYAYVRDLLGYVSSQYQSEIGARLNLAQVRIYTSSVSDPWSSTTSTSTLLNELQAYWNAAARIDQARHHVHLLAGRDTYGGIAYVGTLDSASKTYAYGVSGSISGAFSVSNPKVLWDSVVVAHELGHAFGSSHTHSFDNPPYGSSQGGAIDCCVSQSSGQCATQLGGVGRTGVLPGIGSTTGGTAGAGAGTIMSYCHFPSPGMSNISYNFGTNHTRGVNAWRVASVMQSSTQAYLPLDTTTTSYALSVARSGSGSGIVTSSPSGIDCGSTCSGNFAASSSVTLTAQAATGSTFAGWVGSCSGSASSCTVSMVAPRSVTATFNTSQATTRLVTLTKSGSGTGTITSTPSGMSCGTDCTNAVANFDSTTAVTLSAQAASGSTFAGWSGACQGSSSTCTLAAGTTSSSVTATFSPSTAVDGVVTLLERSNLSGVSGSSAVFSVQVPAGASNLVVSTSGGTGDVDVYLRAGSTPTLQTYDCISASTGNAESCGLATPKTGTYYILLDGYTAYSGVALRATYRTPMAKATLNVAKAGTGQGTVSSTSTIAAKLPTDNDIPANNTPDTPTIVGGVPAASGAWPWQVQLSIATSQGTFLCGGSLIDAQWVLTAAHCISTASGTVSPSSVTVRAGSLNKSSGGTVASVSSIIKHYAYEAATYDNDIALLRLTSALPLSSTIKAVSPLSLSQEGQLAKTNTVGTVTGWGTTSPGGSTSSVLMQVQVLLLTPSDCVANSAYGSGSLSNNMICAGYPSGGKDSCQGDSGGPLVVPNGKGGHVLAGIVSWGNSCAVANYPGVYTRVANYQTWLQKHTQLALGAPLLDCGSTCSATVDSGTTITLRAVASTGSTFTGWGGACSGSTDTCTVLLDRARDVTANFSTGNGGDTSAYSQQVATMFTGYFGRPAGASGQAYYENVIAQSGGNYRILLDDFYNSTEAQAIYRGLSVSGQVTQVFRQLFSRDPQSSGLQYWTQLVNQGIISMPEVAYIVAYNAADADSVVLNAKRRAALAFAKALASNTQYANAYGQRLALGRAYLSCVNSDAAADAAIARLTTTMINMVAGATTYTCP